MSNKQKFIVHLSDQATGDFVERVEVEALDNVEAREIADVQATKKKLQVTRLYPKIQKKH